MGNLRNPTDRTCLRMTRVDDCAPTRKTMIACSMSVLQELAFRADRTGHVE